jgi:MFS family permease
MPTTDADTPSGPDLAAVQQRTVGVLLASQVFGGIGVAVGLGVGTLMAQQLTKSAALIGLVPTAGVLGAALTAFPLARLAARRGRRVGLMLGYLLGAGGALLVAGTEVFHSYPLLLIGYAVMGMATAAGLQARYAATDLATRERRGRQLSVVVWATTIGAVGGSSLLGLATSAARAAGLPGLAGPYLAAIAGYLVSAVVIWVRLRPDPLTVARQRTGPPRRVPLGEVLRTMRSSRLAIGAVAAIAVAHAVMLGVMSFTPLQMGMGGASYGVIGLALALHIFGMYGLSPVMGWLTDRVGRRAVVRGGLVLLVAGCAAEGLAPAMETGWLAVGLLLLGLGWSAVLVAGSTLLTDAVPEAIRPSAQGVFDLAMNIGGVLGGTLTGIALQAAGFSAMTAMAGGLAALTALAAFPPGTPAPLRRFIPRLAARPAGSQPAGPALDTAMEQVDEN